MPFCRFEPTLHSHPKIVALSDPAYRVWTCSVSWSLANLTDGALPPVEAPRNPLRLSLGLAPRRFEAIAHELTDAGLWETNGVGLRVHDYEDYQPSKEEVEREREMNRERQRKWRERRGSDGGSNGVNDGAVTKPVRPSVRSTPPTPPRGVRRGARRQEPPTPQPPPFTGRCEECGLSVGHDETCSKADQP